MLFRDRVDAGEQLAKALSAYRDDNAVIYALPRGGVVLGAVIAKALRAPFDVVIARKIGHPQNPEYGICAISESGFLECNKAERALVDEHWFAEAKARAQQEATSRRERYLAEKPQVSPEGKVAILVDDGIATGLTMFAAIDEIKSRHPREIVVAVPVIPPETVARLQQEVDRVIAVDIPTIFLGAVGAYYDDFTQVSDEEVIRLLREDPLIIFHLSQYRELAEQMLQSPGMLPGRFSTKRFANAEIQLMVDTAVAGEPCAVLGTIAPPDDHLLTSLLLGDALKSLGAKKVIGLFPYLAYMRQEKDESGKSPTTAWVGALLQASGFDEVLTVDIHSQRAMDKLPISIVSLSSASLFAQKIRELGMTDATLVAPDEGGIPRYEAVRESAVIPTPIAYMEKHRTPEGVQGTLHGEVGRRAIVVDDILDTGGTLVLCCEALQQAGAEEIIVMITHGLFTGDRWLRLWELGVVQIYCTDTVPLPPQAHFARIEVLSVLPLLAPILQGEAGE